MLSPREPHGAHVQTGTSAGVPHDAIFGLPEVCSLVVPEDVAAAFQSLLDSLSPTAKGHTAALIATIASKVESAIGSALRDQASPHFAAILRDPTFQSSISEAAKSISITAVRCVTDSFPYPVTVFRDAVQRHFDTMPREGELFKALQRLSWLNSGQHVEPFESYIELLLLKMVGGAPSADALKGIRARYSELLGADPKLVDAARRYFSERI